MLRLLREPLLHFLILGSVLFLVFNVTSETDQPGERRIVVTSGQVEQLAAQFSRTWLRPPTPRELEELIDRYVRSEIYYREALAMGLGQDDPYIRNRLAIKLEVLLDDLSAEADPADGELARFLEARAAQFAIPARLSFRQVYLNPDRHDDPAAEAQRLLDRLRSGADFDTLGDVSMLASGLDASTPDEIARQFGDDFAAELEDIEPGAWAGPVQSPFGMHLVLVTQRQPARLPALEDIQDSVLAEWREERRREAGEQAYQRLRERYVIAREPGALAGESGPDIADADAPETARGQQ